MVGLVVGAAVALSTISVATGGVAGSPAKGSIPCDLKLRFGHVSKNYPGQFHLNLVIVSSDDIACRVSGYPDVELIGPVYPTYGSIYVLPQSVGRTESVSLRLGQSAHAVLTWLPSGFSRRPYRWTPDYVRVVVHTNRGPSFAMALPWRLGSVERQDAATHPGTYVGPVHRGTG